MNKKGFELSINFIVMLIITIIVFGGSIFIATKVMGSVNTFKAKMDTQTEQRLEAMVTSGNEEVVIAFNKREVKGGQAAVFGIGVLNTLGAKKDFSVNVTPSIGVYANGSMFTFDSTSAQGWNYIKSDTIGLIENNDNRLHSIVIIPPKSARYDATYVFDVVVSWKDSSSGVSTKYPLRDPVKKIRVIIN